MPKTIVTCYHFGRRQHKDFERLLRTLKASLAQIDASSHLVLVANNFVGAEPPDAVIAALRYSGPVAIHPIAINTPNGHCGSLNAGITEALRLASSGPDEWIGCVQSSATLTPGWLDSAQPCMQDRNVGAVYGRIVIEPEPVERNPETVWSDGHQVCQGLTRDYNSEVPLDRARRPCGGLPCLSASFWRRSLIEAIVAKFGDFVCENLPHYGDCTDVAHRAKDVDAETQFRYSAGSVALKRKPDWGNSGARFKIACSQIMAAQLYYDGRAHEADLRATRKLDQETARQVREDAATRLAGAYSPKDATPPRASPAVDPAWSTK